MTIFEWALIIAAVCVGWILANVAVAGALIALCAAAEKLKPEWVEYGNKPKWLKRIDRFSCLLAASAVAIFFPMDVTHEKGKFTFQLKARDDD